MLRAARFACLVLASACATRSQTLPSAAQRELVSPRTDDRPIYEGDVFDRDAGPDAAPLFRYRRFVGDAGALRRSTHLTTAVGSGAPVMAMTATHDAAYRLASMTVVDGQRGVVSRVRMRDERHAELEVQRGGRLRRRVRRVDAPVVVGPTLFGYARAHWDALLGGAQLEVAFAVPEALGAYCFVLALEGREGDAVRLSFTACSAIVRAAVPAMRLVFDARTRDVVRYEGRVPPRRLRGRRLVPLDARVEYRHVAAHYE
jgi:hypothetical protein